MAVELLENLFFIERGFLNGNHFVYRGEENVLIDTAYAGGLDETLREITALGVDPARVDRIVTTHVHCDHMGGNLEIFRRSGCRIALHRIGRHFMEYKNSWAAWWSYFNQEADFFPCHESLVDGDRVGVGPYVFTAIHTPGHAADGLVLYEPESRLLISSDCLWESDVAALVERVEGGRCLLDQLDSLERLSRLDVRLVCPGHGPPFADAARAVARTRERVESYLSDPARLGRDLIKRIMIYTLMMRPEMEESDFFDHLMSTPWFPETVRRYLGGGFRDNYDEIMGNLQDRGLAAVKDGRLTTSVRP